MKFVYLDSMSNDVLRPAQEMMGRSLSPQKGREAVCSAPTQFSQSVGKFGHMVDYEIRIPQNVD